MCVTKLTAPSSQVRQRFGFFAAAVTALAMLTSLITPSAGAAEMAQLTVTIKAVDGGNPADSIVEILDPETEQVIAESDGESNGVFRLDGLPTGQVLVRASTWEPRQLLSEQEMTLNAGDNSLVFNLADTHGEVTGIFNTPLPDRYYSSVCAVSEQQEYCTSPEWFGDDQAKFWFTDGDALRAGTYSLEFGLWGAHRWSDQDAVEFGTMTVTAGEIVEREFSLQPTQRSYFFGIAQDDQGAAIKGATGVLRTAYGEFPFTTGYFGQFFVHGKFFGPAWVDFDDAELRPMGDSFWVRPGEFALHTISYATMERTQISGVVRDVDNRVVPGAAVEACITPDNMHRPGGGQQNPMSSHADDGSDSDEVWGPHPDGSCFTVTANNSGEYTLRLPRDRHYVARATADGLLPDVQKLYWVGPDDEPVDFVLGID